MSLSPEQQSRVDAYKRRLAEAEADPQRARSPFNDLPYYRTTDDRKGELRNMIEYRDYLNRLIPILSLNMIELEDGESCPYALR